MTKMAEFDAAALARKHGILPFYSNCIFTDAITEAHAAGRAEGLRRAFNALCDIPTVDRSAGVLAVMGTLKSELEATNG